jgi:hypothetical protein
VKAVDLAGLDHENVAGAGFELLSIHGPEAATLGHELDFVVRMTMRPGTAAGKRAEEKGGDVDVAVIGSDEVVRAALKREVLLTHAVHPAMLL